MEELFGFILELLLEVLIQLVFEGAVAVASRASGGKGSPGVPRRRRHLRFAPFFRSTLSRTNPSFTILKFTVLGLALGFLSVLVLPHPLVHPSKLYGISLLISPVITGLIMGLVGRTVRQRGKSPVRIESFAYGFTFAFAFTLIRLFIVR